jgi:hypothetical protein
LPFGDVSEPLWSEYDEEVTRTAVRELEVSLAMLYLEGRRVFTVRMKWPGQAEAQVTGVWSEHIGGQLAAHLIAESSTSEVVCLASPYVVAAPHGVILRVIVGDATYQLLLTKIRRPQ